MNSNISCFHTTQHHISLSKILDKHVPSSLINTIKLTADIVTSHRLGHVVPAGRGVRLCLLWVHSCERPLCFSQDPPLLLTCLGTPCNTPEVRSLGSVSTRGRAGETITNRLKIPTLPSPDKAEGGDGHWAFGWRRGPNPLQAFRRRLLRGCHLHTGRGSRSRWFSWQSERLKRMWHRMRREMGSKSVRTPAMDTTMRETGNTSRAKEVGEWRKKWLAHTRISNVWFIKRNETSSRESRVVIRSEFHGFSHIVIVCFPNLSQISSIEWIFYINRKLLF